MHRVIHFFQDFQSCEQVLLEKRMNQDFPGGEKKREIIACVTKLLLSMIYRNILNDELENTYF